MPWTKAYGLLLSFSLKLSLNSIWVKRSDDSFSLCNLKILQHSFAANIFCVHICKDETFSRTKLQETEKQSNKSNKRIIYPSVTDVTCKLCVTFQTLSANALSVSALRPKSYAFLYSKNHKSLKFIDNCLAGNMGTAVRSVLLYQ